MKRKLLIVLAALLIAPILIWFVGRFVLSFSVADYSGEIAISGVKNPVEITFDERGIPQIWAETDDDLNFSLGWLHASERLFQMELTRRYVRGELSEAFGEAAYEVDKRQRRLRFKRIGRMAEAELTPETAQALESYCAGINAWIEHKSILPPEFVILGIDPEPWKIKDCLSIASYQTWYAHSLMDREPEFRALADSLGEAVFEKLHQPQNWSPATVPPISEDAMFSAINYDFRMTEASNSWVIAPQKSASGAAIHSSDPHLEVRRVPGFWYLAGLHSAQGTDVLGVTVPGIPGVVMGHNGKIAFAFTVASVDVIDYYRFTRDPQDSLKIITPEGSVALEVFEEKIPVKDESRSRSETMFATPFGPVIDMQKDHVVVIRWAGWDFSPAKMMASSLELQNADNFADFRKIVTNFGALDVNWTYSDIRGNIGYQLGAPIPVRNDINTYALLNGADSVQHWSGYHPLEETPYVFNPPSGWAATCNNRIVSESEWPYPLPGFYDPYRITRVTQLLQEKQQFSVEDCFAMQMDDISGVAMRWKQLMADGARTLNNTELAAEIDNWNGAMTADSKTAATFRLWWEFLPKPVFEDELGDGWKTGKRILEETLSDGWATVIDDKRTGDKVENMADVSGSALQYVLDTFGRPAYGEINKLVIDHPLGVVSILDTWLGLNRGPYPIGGDNGTLNANFNFWIADEQEFHCAAAPSMRFVLDWADVDGFTINGNLGQSGNPFSPHYDDFLKMWQEGKRWNVPFSREKVFARKTGLLKLLPGK
ncbi:MAG: penicillin acylase family protein [Calditrichia bacterium]